ncbi:heavy metal translocating P-type ATPase [Roseococcus sp. YIM B11640]|uniref:heavy metal translocating P-type ATPase n=1 Tax=Roseococcus sp. YIM B11640 TaxID=3133973 RepID=UPI003C7E1120
MPVDRRALLALPLLGLAAGLLAAGSGADSSIYYALGTLPVLAVLLVEMVRSLRAGILGLDAIAALAMAAGLALGEPLAANIVGLMYALGQFLEDYAHRRAGAEMTALMARQPRSVMRHEACGLVEIPIESVASGDLLLIPRGAILPVDGTLASDLAVLDTAALTGEPMPVRYRHGETLLSGCGNAGETFDLRATTDARASTYARIMDIVRDAAESRAPMSRLADRWSLVFLVITLVLAGGAWIVTGEARRALAVLVIATPCPLILAVPVALLAGLSRAAKLGLLVKSAAVLESLARIRVLVTDKTGTLTLGSPAISEIAGDAEALRMGASLDQATQHPVARALVAAARERGLVLATPEDVREVPGEGLEGRVGGRQVAVGGARWIAELAGAEPPSLPAHDIPPGSIRCAIALDGKPAATLLLHDPPRSEAREVVDALRRGGVERIVLASGDALEPVEAMARHIGADAAHARQTPASKVVLVESERQNGPVLMLGDGLNDAPALASADVGLAVGTRGAAAAQAADAVLLADNLRPLVAAHRAARHARDIALQSALAGIGLSAIGMLAAAFGYLAPVEGALLQQGIDAAVVLNALRALKD